MGGCEFGGIPSKDEIALDTLVERVANMLASGELSAKTNILLLHDFKRRTWPWGTTIALTSRKSDDQWFEFSLLDSVGKNTHTKAYVSENKKIGVANRYGLVTTFDSAGSDHATWLNSLQTAIDRAPVRIFGDYHGVI